jgi:aminoglycoside phosphotransferase (APT) family kinase protein
MAKPFLLDPPEVAPVRAGEEFDTGKVEVYLKEQLAGLEGPMEVLQFPGGHANLTYLLRFGDRELVLRRPPLGPVAPRSHDMAREYRVLSRLADRFPPAPHAYLLCEDPSVIGATFLIMERRRGLVMRGLVPAELDRHPDARRRMSFALVDVMAAFHDVDYEELGLGDLGKPEGYVERQVHGWKGRWERAKHQDLPVFDELYEWLVANLPPSTKPTLVHNDLKFDNVMFDPDDPDHVEAILDWDMTTLGDPLIDLGTLVCYWAPWVAAPRVRSRPSRGFRRAPRSPRATARSARSTSRRCPGTKPSGFGRPLWCFSRSTSASHAGRPMTSASA